jgi:hypothetical protein
VITKNIPKIKIIQWNFIIRAAPIEIRIALIIIAPIIPQNNTLCWYFFGTLKNDNSKMKTKILSTLKEYSSR